MSENNVEYYLLSYSSLLDRKRMLETDIVDTKEVLKDKNLSYVDKRECLNDIIYDEMQLAKIESDLNRMVSYLKENNINLDEYLSSINKKGM